ncbi:uncharacterized protein [Petaurus breviceps papuanus]|uniref:uncharacterized protein isoform X1 n=1 Tax=Petaurus breviceps papuanus TaxID=3040969 RepID=UPI0036DEEC4C
MEGLEVKSTCQEEQSLDEEMVEEDMETPVGELPPHLQEDLPEGEGKHACMWPDGGLEGCLWPTLLQEAPASSNTEGSRLPYGAPGKARPSVKVALTPGILEDGLPYLIQGERGKAADLKGLDLEMIIYAHLFGLPRQKWSPEMGSHFLGVTQIESGGASLSTLPAAKEQVWGALIPRT